MRFFNLSVLWYLIPWFFLPLGWFFIEKISQKKIMGMIHEKLFDSLIDGFSKKRRIVKFILIWFSFLFFILAWGRPQTSSHEEELKTQGLDMVFLLDVSLSMATEDVVPSRIKKAKHFIKNFLDHLSSDRVGIVAFAGSSAPVVPLTGDYEYVKQELENLDETIVKTQGTDLGLGLEVALKLIDRGGVNPGQEKAGEDKADRIFLVLSDGEDHEGKIPEFAEQLKKQGIRVYSIGVGSFKGGPIPIRDARGQFVQYKKDPQNNLVHSRLETKVLEKIAALTGGKYFNASTEESEIEEILSDTANLERKEGKARKVVVYDEAFQYPLFLGFLFLMIFLFLNDKKTAVLALLFFIPMDFAFCETSKEEYSQHQKGQKKFKEGTFGEAVDHFTKAQAENPESKANHFNLGTALLKSGGAKEAVQELEASLDEKDPITNGKRAYNLGKAFEELKDYENGLKSLQRGLGGLSDLAKEKPLSGEAKEVAEKLKRALRVMEEQKKQQEKSGKDDKDKKDQGSQGGGPGGNDQKNQDKNQGKDDKGDQGENQKPKRYDIPKEKPKFKAENLSEQDAKRLMQQLKENESALQKKLLQNKAQMQRRQAKELKNSKDW